MSAAEERKMQQLLDEFRFWENDSARIGLGSIVTMRGKGVPVKKEILMGPRGGLYYINTNKKVVFLDKTAKRKCLEDHYVPGATNAICSNIKVHQDDVGRSSLPKYGRFYNDGK
jgi:hypothetical protein